MKAKTYAELTPKEQAILWARGEVRYDDLDQARTMIEVARAFEIDWRFSLWYNGVSTQAAIRAAIDFSHRRVVEVSLPEEFKLRYWVKVVNWSNVFLLILGKEAPKDHHPHFDIYHLYFDSIDTWKWEWGKPWNNIEKRFQKHFPDQYDVWKMEQLL